MRLRETLSFFASEVRFHTHWYRLRAIHHIRRCLRHVRAAAIVLDPEGDPYGHRAAEYLRYRGYSVRHLQKGGFFLVMRPHATCQMVWSPKNVRDEAIAIIRRKRSVSEN